MMQRNELLKQIICAKIKSQRLALGYTQEDVASLVGCDSKHYGKVERGTKLVGLTFFFTMCDVLQIDPRDVKDEFIHKVTCLEEHFF